jgi:CHAT domain-containing protein
LSGERVEEAVWDYVRSIVPPECFLTRSPRRRTEQAPSRRAGSCDPSQFIENNPADDLKAKQLENAVASITFPEAIERALARYKHVVIVPYGSLSILPFGALTLPRAKSQFVDLAAYTVAPAFTQIGIGAGLHVPRPPSGKKPNAIVVGNPQFVDPGPPVRKDHEWEFDDLPGSESEARAVGALLGVKPLLWDKANVADLSSRLAALQGSQQSLDVLYLATHGVATSDNIEARIEDATSRSFLALRGGERLSSDTLASTGYRGSRLVVLSACLTGRGWIAEGGSVGLPHLFHLNRAEEIVMSLWSVSDDATGYLMQSMMAEYTKHWPKMSAAVALRSAMLKARQRFKHPALWAAFSAFGVAPFVN